MSRYVVDASVILHLLAENIELPTGHQLLAPTSVRSEVLDSLYRAVQRGDLPEEVGRQRLARFAEMKIRYLGDKVLRRRAWELANGLGWDSTFPAEYLALTQLQADAYVTMDKNLAQSVAGVVETVGIEELL
jgi:indolepyruvate ferredoxin oxidoreductase alpha subunit